ncbi:MAG: lipocalin-like domain-containing protein [Muribaculaceae bacterium]|nr:lipocalin-like domain-containing protein [Muribaculaceae bacterium]MDE6533851.1 lipocalin-like domain-containing protein [Muribaculaceae bacterium]MDE6772379.1 lipocalin-like domain-containing protein [Muribaculaceae bacterium]
MKKTFFPYLMSIILLVACQVLSVSCQKSPINGDLDGQWQVMSVEPQPEEPDQMFDTRLYYCFSLHVCQLSIPGGVWLSGRLSFNGDEIALEFPESLNILEKRALLQYGINHNPVTFRVETLDKSRLVMRDGETVVTLRKF